MSGKKAFTLIFGAIRIAAVILESVTSDTMPVCGNSGAVIAKSDRGKNGLFTVYLSSQF
jgi:hypothetical protein